MVNERPQASCKNWRSSGSIKDRITLIIGFSGLLLWFVLKAITKLNFDEYEAGSIIIKPVFLIAAFSFTVSILIGMLTYYKMKSPYGNTYSNDQSKWMMNAVKWFLFGLFSFMIPIPLILFPEQCNFFTIYLFALTLAGK